MIMFFKELDTRINYYHFYQYRPSIDDAIDKKIKQTKSAVLMLLQHTLFDVQIYHDSSRELITQYLIYLYS